MAEEQQTLTAEAIVDKAFDYFEKLVSRGKQLDGVLLEGLEPEDDGWIVSIGFNGRRYETSEPTSPSAMAALSGFGSKTTKTVREVRHFHLDKQGNFQRLT
ncbi:MAG: hypothetical protein HLUCCO07_16485 [Rhodobacteraceae bacterium HLUCCO07]|nr:MAG: hypothetical protein HLUCCO07_16485 [Rhodobacteraceae bacterium HLUCCO07]